MNPPRSWPKLYRGICKGIKMPNNSVDAAVDAVENFEYRKDDVWLIGYHKSGELLTSEICRGYSNAEK